MQKPQTQKPSKGNSTPQAFHDLVRSLLSLLVKLYTDSPALVIIFIFVVFISVYLLLKAINSNYTYSLSVTFLFMFLSLGLYFKDKSFLSAIVAFSLGIFTAFTVTWNSSTFSIFVFSFFLLFVILFLLECIRLAANVEEKLTRAANFYISDFATNKKDLQEVVAIITQHKHDKGGLLSPDQVHDAMLFFAHHKVPKSRMILLITELSYLYPLTKVDVESLLLLLNNVNYVSQTEEDLTTNLIALQHCLREARSTPSSLVKLLNEALPIAIENEIDFVLFTNTILTYLSRGYPQTSIVEKLSRKFTKKIP
jgi:hypothetical protein